MALANTPRAADRGSVSISRLFAAKSLYLRVSGVNLWRNFWLLPCTAVRTERPGARFRYRADAKSLPLPIIFCVLKRMSGRADSACVFQNVSISTQILLAKGTRAA